MTGRVDYHKKERERCKHLSLEHALQNLIETQKN